MGAGSGYTDARATVCKPAAAFQPLAAESASFAEEPPGAAARWTVWPELCISRTNRRVATFGEIQNGILVVEDDREIRSALAELLQDEGYTVEVAGDGEKALERLRTFSPRAILLDLMLPVMDGWTFLSECRGDPRCHDIPIVVMSAAHDLHTHVEQLTRQGVRAVIGKPFDLQALLGLLHRYAPIAT